MFTDSVRRTWRRLPARRVLAGLAGLLVLGGAAVAIAPLASADEPVVVLSNDFEDGTAQGWFARGPSTVAATTAAAHSGTRSLLSSGRTDTWQGPGRNMLGTIVKGGTYAIQAQVRLVAGASPVAVHITMQRTPVDGSQTFERVASATVTDSAWTSYAAEYTTAADNSELQLYFESADATVSFYVDDIVVTQIAAPPTGPPGTADVITDFETGTSQGWAPRISSEQLTVTDAAAHGGTRSLLTTNRQNTFDGPALNVLGKMVKGSTYNLSVWVRLAPGQAPAQIRMSLERRLNGTPNYETLAGNATVTPDAWVQLSTTYTFAFDADFLSLYLETASGLASFYLDDFAMVFVPPVPIQTDIPSLKDVLTDWTVGTAIDRTETVGVHSELLLKHFGSVTPGNALKWDSTEPTEGTFNWAEADSEVNFGASHGLKVRGHTLVWHNQTPAWVFQRPDGTPLTNSPEDKALLLTRLSNHIRAEVGRYADRVYAWDVANEVIDEYQPDGMRRSPWFQVTGLDFLRTAFRVAHEVDPDAKLFINDYNTEFPRKGQFLYNLVRQLRAEGVPIDGVGHQLHTGYARVPVADIEQTIQKFAALGVDQQVTELDMSIYQNFTDTSPTVPAETLVEQGYRYRDLFDVFRRQKAHLSAVTIWGQSDDNTWLRTFPIARMDRPLLFDDHLQAKPAYWGVVDRTQLAPLVYKVTVPQAAIKVDGQRDAQWDLLPSTSLFAASGARADFQLRWNAGKLYVIVDVADATTNGKDAVEVTVDGVTFRFGRSGQATDKLPGGYRIEAAVPTGSALSLRVKDTARPTDDLSWSCSLTLVSAVSTVDAVRGVPVIDGTADAVWANARTITPAVQLIGSGGATVTAKLLWDEGHLYVLATVTDPNLDESSVNAYEQDSVEIFVDPDNGKTVGYGDTDGQYRISFSNHQTISGIFNAFAISGNLTSATRTTSTGYVVEAAIAIPTVRLGEGSLLGFDLQLNDATGGVRTAAVGWNDPTGLSYLNTSRWGVVRLVRR